MFEVGKKAIAAKTTELYKKGEIREVQGIRNGICNCTPLLLDMGYKADTPHNGYLRCPKCSASIFDITDTLWCSALNWNPISDISRDKSETTIEIILEPEKQLA